VTPRFAEHTGVDLALIRTNTRIDMPPERPEAFAGDAAGAAGGGPMSPALAGYVIFSKIVKLSATAGEIGE
jgi:hypothetical protein